MKVLYAHTSRNSASPFRLIAPKSPDSSVWVGRERSLIELDPTGNLKLGANAFRGAEADNLSGELLLRNAPFEVGPTSAKMLSNST